ncbi:MAG: protein-disulfide reductase DsbD domain-containing protein, partial [Jannaschia sp.]
MFRILLLTLGLLAQPLLAATSDPVETRTVVARLVSAADGVGQGTTRLQAGLQLTMTEGWKTYWRSPGEVGLPPELSWEGSENIADVTLAYPAPTRFTAFDIENFGYGGEVVFPLVLALTEAGKPARLDLTANLLVCAEVCVPETVSLTLDLPAGGAVDAAGAALLTDWVGRVPLSGDEVGLRIERAHLGAEALTVSVRADAPFLSPDIFPELGAYGAFGKPDIRLSEGGTLLWARLPVLSPGEGTLDLTLVDGGLAATMPAALDVTPPLPPDQSRGFVWMLLMAFLGGVILNAMPCVLPVLSIKLASALQAKDKGAARVRAGFLVSAAGVMAFFLALAALVIGLRAGGVAVGWGVQFQSPVFLSLMIGLMVLFAANMMGFFEFAGLSSDTLTGMARTETHGGLRGDFATGAFAAVMATPCSAPFVGTAVTYALTNGAGDTLAIFVAMGIGLAMPYLAVAASPGLLRHLPRPGRWMAQVRIVLGGLLLAAAVWLLTVLAGAAGWTVAGSVAVVAVLLLGGMAVWRRGLVPGAVGVVAMLALAAVLPAAPAGPGAISDHWQVFARDRIAEDVARGQVVFVDVTADWCLTCKVNKRVVLEAAPVAGRLADAGVPALRADWTRPG